MPVSGNTLECIIQARDQFSAKFESIMNRAMTSMQKGQKQTDFFSGSLVRMFAKFSIIEHGIRRVASMFEQMLYPLKAVEEINMSLIRMSALFTGMMEAPAKGKTIADQFNQASAYSERLFQTLVRINPYIAGGLKDLMLMTEEMAKQGIVLDINNEKQVRSFQNIANAVMTVSAGYQNREVQIRQEARSLMEGVIRPTNQLAMMVNAMVGGNLKVMVDQWKRQGTLIENMGMYLKGFDAASGRISLTWDAVKTTFESIIQLAMYEKFQGLYTDLMKQGVKLNDWLMENKDIVGGYVKAVWDTLAATVGTVVKAFKDLASILDALAGRDFTSAIPKNLIFFFTVLLPKLYETTTMLGQIGKELDKIEKRGKPKTKEEEGILDIFKEAFGPVGKSLRQFGIRLLQEAGWNIDELKKEYRELGIQLGEAYGEGFDEEYDKIARELMQRGEPALKLMPPPPDPEAVKKYEEFMSAMEDLITKKGDTIWGSFWVKYYKGEELAIKAGVKDMTEFENTMAVLSFEYLNKQKIADSEMRIKILTAARQQYGGEELLILEKAKLMELQGKNEVQVKEWTSAETTKLAQKDFEDYVKYTIRRGDVFEAQVKREIAHTNRLRDSKHDAYVKWYEDLKIIDEERESAYTKEGEMYGLLMERSGKYFDFFKSRAIEGLKLEKEAVIERFRGLIDVGVIEEYYAQKTKDKILEIREANLKNSQEFTEGWNVAYQKNLQDQYTWGQAGLQAYGEVSKAMSQTFSDFFYDAWTGKLKTAEQYFRSFTQSLLRIFADMVSKMIAQDAMLAVTRIFGGWWGGGTTGYGGMDIGETYHQGGYVPRLHKGLASDEFPAILQSGERVLSRSEVTSLDSTRGKGGDTNIVINAVDARSFQQLLWENRSALDSLVASSISVNGQTRKALRR